MIRLCEYICAAQLVDDSTNCFIDTPITGWTTDLSFRIKGQFYYHQNGKTVVGIGVENSPRFFFTTENRLYYDLNGRLEYIGFEQYHESEADFDLTISNYQIYDNLTEQVLSSKTTSNSTYNGTIHIEVGSFRFKSIEIYKGNTLVFDGNAAYDENNGNIGIYDSITDTLYTNNAELTRGNPLGMYAYGESVVDAQECDTAVGIDSDYAWTASTSSSYASFVSGSVLVSAVTGTNLQHLVTVRIEANSGATERNVAVDFVNTNGETETFNITQKVPNTNSYVFCEWIEGQYGNGGSWLDLGIYPSINTEVELDLESCRLMGSSNARIIGNEDNGGLLLYSKLKDYAVANFGNKTDFGDDYSMAIYDSKMTFKMSQTGITRDYYDEYPPRVSEWATVTAFTGTSTTLKINGNGTEIGNAMRYGSVVVRDNGNVVFDGKPCIYGSKVGLYDFVSNSFIAGQGKPFFAINKFGYVVLGDEIPESFSIGDATVEKIYLGDELIYLPSPFQGLKLTTGATLGTNSGSTSEISIKSSEPWQLSIDSAATWLSASTMSGTSGTSAITLTAVGSITANMNTVITASTSSYSATCSVERKIVDIREYLQTTSQMYFETNINPANGYTYHLKFIPVDAADWSSDGFPQFFGNTDNGIMVRGNGGGFNRNVNIQYGSKGIGNQSWTWAVGTEFDIYLYPSGTTVNGVDYSFGGTGSISNTKQLCINAFDYNTSQSSPNRWGRNQSAKYEFIGIYDSAGTAIAEFLPALDSSSVPCFYDRVNDTYIYNGGSGTPIVGSAVTTTPAVQVQDAISASSLDDGDNQFSIYGSFTSATYDSIWECKIDAQVYIDAIDMGDDPDDIDWVKSQGWHNQSVTATTNTTFDFESNLVTTTNTQDENYCHYYAFLYDSVNDVISDTYYYEYFEGTPIGDGGGDNPIGGDDEE